MFAAMAAELADEEQQARKHPGPVPPTRRPFP
jgi:hypothetical protein